MAMLKLYKKKLVFGMMKKCFKNCKLSLVRYKNQWNLMSIGY